MDSFMQLTNVSSSRLSVERLQLVSLDRGLIFVQVRKRVLGAVVVCLGCVMCGIQMKFGLWKGRELVI